MVLRPDGLERCPKCKHQFCLGECETKMISVRFYTGNPRPIPHLQAYYDWEYQLAEHFGGYTKYTTRGAWRDLENNVTFENSLVYEVIFSEVAFPRWEMIVRHFKRTLGEALEQKEILVTSHSVNIH